MACTIRLYFFPSLSHIPDFDAGCAIHSSFTQAAGNPNRSYLLMEKGDNFAGGGSFPEDCFTNRSLVHS